MVARGGRRRAVSPTLTSWDQGVDPVPWRRPKAHPLGTLERLDLSGKICLKWWDQNIFANCKSLKEAKFESESDCSWTRIESEAFWFFICEINLDSEICWNDRIRMFLKLRITWSRFLSRNLFKWSDQTVSQIANHLGMWNSNRVVHRRKSNRARRVPHRWPWILVPRFWSLMTVSTNRPAETSGDCVLGGPVISDSAAIKNQSRIITVPAAAERPGSVATLPGAHPPSWKHCCTCKSHITWILPSRRCDYVWPPTVCGRPRRRQSARSPVHCWNRFAYEGTLRSLGQNVSQIADHLRKKNSNLSIDANWIEGILFSISEIHLYSEICGNDLTGVFLKSEIAWASQIRIPLLTRIEPEALCRIWNRSLFQSASRSSATLPFARRMVRAAVAFDWPDRVFRTSSLDRLKVSTWSPTRWTYFTYMACKRFASADVSATTIRLRCRFQRSWLCWANLSILPWLPAWLREAIPQSAKWCWNRSRFADSNHAIKNGKFRSFKKLIHCSWWIILLSFRCLDIHCQVRDRDSFSEVLSTNPKSWTPAMKAQTAAGIVLGMGDVHSK